MESRLDLSEFRRTLIGNDSCSVRVQSNKRLVFSVVIKPNALSFSAVYFDVKVFLPIKSLSMNAHTRVSLIWV